MDNHPISAHLLGLFFHLDGKQLQEHYKNHLSDFHDWDQKAHAERWTVFPENTSEQLSIDETSFSNGELYTIVSSKAGRGRRGTVLATIRGTKAGDIIDVLERIPLRMRNRVREVTMDMAPNMAKAIRRCFRNAKRVIDRFHVQKLAYDAVQELRIKYRWGVLDEESKKIAVARKQGVSYDPEILSNGDTLKQLLARSRHLLFKHPSRWTESQKHRAELLFLRFPLLKKAYELGSHLEISSISAGTRRWHLPNLDYGTIRWRMPEYQLLKVLPDLSLHIIPIYFTILTTRVPMPRRSLLMQN